MDEKSPLLDAAKRAMALIERGIPTRAEIEASFEEVDGRL